MDFRDAIKTRFEARGLNLHSLAKHLQLADKKKKDIKSALYEFMSHEPDSEYAGIGSKALGRIFERLDLVVAPKEDVVAEAEGMTDEWFRRFEKKLRILEGRDLGAYSRRLGRLYRDSLRAAGHRRQRDPMPRWWKDT
jgi:hypothetical protein